MDITETCVEDLLAIVEKRLSTLTVEPREEVTSRSDDDVVLNDVALPNKYISMKNGSKPSFLNDLRVSLKANADGSVMLCTNADKRECVRRFIPIEIHLLSSSASTVSDSERMVSPRMRMVSDMLEVAYLLLPIRDVAACVAASEGDKEKVENTHETEASFKRELTNLFEARDNTLINPVESIDNPSDLFGTLYLRIATDDQQIESIERLTKIAKDLQRHCFQGLTTLREVLQHYSRTNSSLTGGQLSAQVAKNLLEFYRFDPMIYNMGTTLPIVIHGKHFLRCIFPTTSASGKSTVRIKLSHHTSTCSSAFNGIHSGNTSGEYMVDDWEVLSDSEWRIHPPILDIPGLYILSISLDKGETWLASSRLNLMIMNHKQIHVALNCGGPAYVSTRGVYYMSHAELCRRGYIKQGLIDYRNSHPFTRRALLPIIGSQDEILYQSWVISMNPTVEIEFSIPVEIGQSYYVILKFTDSFFESSKMNPHNTTVVINGVDKGSFVVPQEAALAARRGFTRSEDGDLEAKALSLGRTGSAAVDYQKSTVYQAQYYMPFMETDHISILLPRTHHINALVIVKGDSPDPGLCQSAFVNPAVSSTTTSNNDIEKAISQFEGISLKSSMFLLEYEGKPTSENLIINSSGELGDLTEWDILADGGAGWRSSPAGMEGCSTCFKSSYDICIKAQTVDLMERKGCSEEFLQSKPAIHVGDNVSNGVGDCTYAFRAELLDRDGETVIDTYEYHTTALKENLQIRHSFTSYLRPAYYVRITHAGKDGVYWGGHCGPSVYQTFVTVTLSQKFYQKNNNNADTNTHMNQQEKKQLNQLADDPMFNNNEEKIIAKCRATAKKVREVKFFVSSTFRDFIAERDHLSRKIFVNIRAFCEERNIAFTEIDLRWGVLGCADTIEICLDGIDECRPFYMCMLAERYGWSQPLDAPLDTYLDGTKKKAQAKYEKEKKYDWIDNFPNSSVTELEIRHAVLNHLHLLSKSNSENLTEQERKLLQSVRNVQFYFRNNDTTGRLHQGDDFKSESPFHASQMKKLKDEICNYGCFDILEYTKVEDLGRVVYEKTIQQIQEQYPLQSKPDKLEVERDLHDNFAAFRARCYVKIQKYFVRLNDFFDQMNVVKDLPDDHPQRLIAKKPLVVYGNSGSGKSALVANWWMQCEEYLLKTYSKLLIVTHYIGATVDSTNHFSLMRRIMLEIKAHLSLPQDVPIDPLQIQKEFPTYLNIASARCPILLIIDALNQLEDRHQALSLTWLPTEFPVNVRVIVSTTEVSPVLAHCRQLGYQELQVTALDADERKTLINDYLKQYSKTLQPTDADFIVQSPCGGSPLFLRSLLEELRMDALYETLTNKIKYYCAAKDLESFFELMLQRFELQYENETDGTRGVFGAIFAAIALSRHGISEREIIKLTNLDRSVLQPFFNVLHGFLVSRGGLLSFFHDHLRNAVANKYLSSNTEKDISYLRLIAMFESHDSLGRKADELPFHLKSTKQYERLRQVISDISLLNLLLSPEREYDLIDYWKTIQANKDDAELATHSCQPIQSYRQQLDEYMVSQPIPKVIEAIELVGRLMSKLGHKAEAELLFKEALSKRDAMEGAKLSDSSTNVDDDDTVAAKQAVDNITYALEHDFSPTPQEGFCIEDVMIQHYGEPVRSGDTILLRVHNKQVHPVQIVSPTAEKRAKSKSKAKNSRAIIHYGDVVYLKTVSLSPLDTSKPNRAAEYVTKDYEGIAPGYYWTAHDQKATVDRRSFTEPTEKSAFVLLKLGIMPINESGLPVRYGDIYVSIQDFTKIGFLSDHWNTIEGGVQGCTGDFERWEIWHSCNQYCQYSTLAEAKTALLSIYSPEYGKAIWYDSTSGKYNLCRNKYPRPSKNPSDRIWFYNDTIKESKPSGWISSSDHPVLVWKQLSIERLQNLLSLAWLCLEQEKYDQALKYYSDFFLLFQGYIDRGTGNQNTTSVFGYAYCCLFEHVIAYLHALYGYARVYFLMRKVYECELYLQKFLLYVRLALGENHYYYAIGLSFQSALLFSLKRNDQAKVWMNDCLHILQKNLGMLHPFTGVAFHNLGVLAIKVNGLYAQSPSAGNELDGPRSGEDYLHQAEHVLEMNAGSCQEELISLRLNQVVVLAMKIDDFQAADDSEDGKRVREMRDKIQQCRSLIQVVGLTEDHQIPVSLRKLELLLPTA